MNSFDRWILYLNGMVTAGYAVAALFFARFARRTHDRFFMYFAGAFALLFLQAFALQFVGRTEDDRAPFFLVRLASFALIGWAVIAKNRRRD